MHSREIKKKLRCIKLLNYLQTCARETPREKFPTDLRLEKLKAPLLFQAIKKNTGCKKKNKTYNHFFHSQEAPGDLDVLSQSHGSIKPNHLLLQEGQAIVTENKNNDKIC